MRPLVSLLALSLFLVVAWSTPSPAPSAAPSAPQSPVAGGWTTEAVGTLGDVVYGQGEHWINLAGPDVLYDPVRWVAILDYNTLTIEPGATVRFVNHPTRAPVVIRAVGDIDIAGTLVLDGKQGHAATDFPIHAEPGPGGFRGGTGRHPTNIGSITAAAGHGPGGAFRASSLNSHGGSGSHATAAVGGAPTGPTYGSAGAVPLLGGSGGSGGFSNAAFGESGGGAGGGAVLIGSETRIRVSGIISARGGSGLDTSGPEGGAGSGGSVRLASPIVEDGGGLIDVRGGLHGASSSWTGGAGWIRLEADTHSGTIQALPVASYSGLNEFLPTNLPTVTLSHVWDPIYAGSGGWRPLGQDPRADFGGSTDAQFPEAGVQVLKIEGHDVPLGAPLRVRVTFTRGQAVDLSLHPEGPSIGTPITMGEGNGPDGEASTLATSWTDVHIDFALGVSTVQVRAWLP